MKLQDLDLAGKRVLVRVDFNVPVEAGRVTDDSRIQGAKPTLDLLLDKGASVVLMSHRGRPKGTYKEDLSMAPVLEAAQEVLGRPILPLFSDKVLSKEVIQGAKDLEPGQVALLENLRFRQEEEANDPTFAKHLALLGEVFVNDAFGTSHRAHASNAGVARYLPSYLGLLVEREVQVLGQVLEAPESPYVAILGGSKVSDKIDLIENLMEKLDGLVIVGAMANTFLKAQGHDLGASLVEDDKLDLAKGLLGRAKESGLDLVLPSDLVVAKGLEAESGQVVDLDQVPGDMMALDVGPKTLEAAGGLLESAKTVVWNGPAGVFEKEAFSKGTMGLAEIMAGLDAKTIVGGGDSAAAVKKSGLEDSFYHISSGGGASLTLLEGQDLPGISAILRKDEGQ